MCKKADIVFKTSQEVLSRFSSLANELNASNEQVLVYLLDLHDKTKLGGNTQSAGRPAVEAVLHTCVAPEIKDKFKQIAAEHGMSYSQLLAALLDEHDRCAECEGYQPVAEPAACPMCSAPAAAPSCDEDLANRLESALDTIRDVFLQAFAAGRQAASGEDEIKSLREQLAAAEEDAEKARRSNRKVQDLLNQLTAQLK